MDGWMDGLDGWMDEFCLTSKKLCSLRTKKYEVGSQYYLLSELYVSSPVF